MSTSATQREHATLWATRLAAGLIVLATAAAYSDSLHGPFIFDDGPSIPDNPTIHRLWPIGDALCPPNHGETVTGRPLLNLSLAVNYAIGGIDVRGYHATNLAIHLAAALLLFGLLRRTFLLPAMRGDPWGAAATPLALAIALLWAVHPLQTESVTYVVQRAESLVGLFYLLTLYALVRGATAARPLGWYVVCTLACLAGMASKEVMVSAPLIALLYDRTFLAGSFREALRRRYGLYMALAATWPLLEQLIYASWGRGNTAGFDTGVNCWSYLGMQCRAIVHYLRLAAWPDPLVLDYGKGLAEGIWPLAPCAVAVVLLGVGTAVALWRRPKLGFLGACFFAVLAPTSSIVPVATQPMAEHRMYLPLAAVVAAVVTAAYLGLQGLSRRNCLSRRRAGILGAAALAAAAVALAATTFQRNRDYRDSLSVWADTAAKAPHNGRAHDNMGATWLTEGQSEEALAEYDRAKDLDDRDFTATFNSMVISARLNRLDQQIVQQRQAAAARPDSAEAHRHLAWLLATCPATSRRHGAEAVEHARRAEQLTRGQDPDALDALAAAYAETGQFPKALATARKALKLAQRQDKQELAHGLRTRIAGYEARKPFRAELPEATWPPPIEPNAGPDKPGTVPPKAKK